MNDSIERRSQAVEELRSAWSAGRLSRRDLLARAAALGVSTSALAGLASGFGGSAAAQNATPPVQLGNYSGRTLKLSVALAEDEVGPFQSVVIDGFKSATSGDVELIKIEAADVIKTLQAQVGSGNLQIDMLTQDNNSLAPLVSGGLVEQLPEATQIIPPETIEALIPVLNSTTSTTSCPRAPTSRLPTTTRISLINGA